MPKEPPRPYRERQESNPLSGLWPRSGSPSDMLDAQRAQAGQIVANLSAGGENARRLGAAEFRLDKVEAAVADVGKGVGEIKHTIELQQALDEEADVRKKSDQQRTFALLGLLFTAINIIIQVVARLL